MDAILVGLFAAIFGRAAHTKASQLTFGFVTFFWWPCAFVWGFSRKGEGPVERRDLRFWGQFGAKMRGPTGSLSDRKTGPRYPCTCYTM
jgi:hypothetical protein